MAKQSEKATERKLVEAVKKLGGLCLKLTCPNFTGVPDRMCLLPGGVLIFVEVKSEGRKPTKRQLYVHRQLAALGFTVHVIDKTEQIESVLKVK